MEVCGSGVSGVRSLEICGNGNRSLSRFWKFGAWKHGRWQAYLSGDLRALPRRLPSTDAQRREFALSAHIDDILRAGATRAAQGLKTKWPELSAGTLSWRQRLVPMLFVVFALLATFNTQSRLALCFLIILPTGFRLLMLTSRTTVPPKLQAPCPVPADEGLPIYSIILPLHREARVVNQLLSAIERLDYPPAKLDVIIVMEADEPETRAAITARKHQIPIAIIPLPPTEPRTKPKALNVALEFARGTLTVIYDAEDRPEPNQLRRAVQAFRCAGDDLACVQARLCIDTDTSWLTRYFTAEYAGQFDIILPNLAAAGLPLPLGGSSNHFRTEILREVCGWDAYNVTEDADLGIRLARHGYRCDIIDSTTYEEAPAKICGWLRQRSRWLKGWMQTWLVHMRDPSRLLRELGLRGFLAFQFIVGGNALVALAHPLFLAGMIGDLLGRGTLMNSLDIIGAAVFGYFASGVIGIVGLRHRKKFKKTGVLLMTPVHWLLLSIAGWWAGFQLVYAPSRWSKTEHGLGLTNTLLKLHQHLTDLARRGEIPQIWIDTRDSGANPRLLPRAAA